MTSETVFRSKLAFLRAQLLVLERYRRRTREELEQDIDLRGATERYVFLAVQAAIDLAEVYVAWKNLGTAETMAEAFELLLGHEVIDPPLASRLVKMVGFRNILVHGYQRLNFDFVDAALRSGVTDIESLIDALENRS